VTLALEVPGLDKEGAFTEIPSTTTAALSVKVHPLQDENDYELPSQQEKYWSDYRQDATRSALYDAHAAAEKWEGAIAAGLTVVGAVGFIAAPNEVAMISVTWVKWAALYVFLLAVSSALAAWYLLRKAQDKTPEFGPTEPSWV